MMRLIPLAFLTMSALLAGCSSMSGLSGDEAASAPASTAPVSRQASRAAANVVQIQDEAGSVAVQKVEYRPGVSSASVERLARKFGCEGTNGAGLVTEKGPVEVYRMRCENGTSFLAQCELRQCRPMR
jgi:predicted small secreted protein